MNCNLTLDEYQQQAMRTARDDLTVDTIDGLLISALGLTGEAGEVADHIKKIVYHGHSLTPAAVDTLIEEAGDVLWYLARLARALQINLSDVALMNVAKLSKRYPDGFTVEASKH